MPRAPLVCEHRLSALHLLELLVGLTWGSRLWLRCA